MKFNIEITKENFVSYNQYVTKKIRLKTEENSVVKLLGGSVWVFVILFFFMVYKFYSESCGLKLKSLNLAFLTLGMIFIIYFYWYKYSSILFAENQVSKNGTVLGDWEIEINEDGIHENTQKCSSFFKWECVISIESDKSNLYIFVDSMKAIILPKNQIPIDIELQIHTLKNNIN